MFYVFDDEVKSIDVDEIGKNMLTLGFITVGELERLAAVFSLPKNIVELCRKKSDSSFLTKFINDDFSFIRINIICNKESRNEYDENCEELDGTDWKDPAFGAFQL